MELGDDASVGSEASGLGVRDSARRPAERVTASAIARRALQRSLAEDTSALADLVSQGALDASSSSSSSSEGGSGGESDGSSDGDAGAGESVA